MFRHMLLHNPVFPFSIAGGSNLTMLASDAQPGFDLVQLGGTGGLIAGTLWALRIVWKERSELKKEISEERVEHREEVKELRDHHSKILAQLTASHREEIQNLSDRYTEELKQQIDALRAEQDAALAVERQISDAAYKEDKGEDALQNKVD